MEYKEIATNDVDQLFEWTSGFDYEVMQLSRGRLGFRCQDLELPGVSIRWNFFDQSVLIRQTLDAWTLVFALVLDSTASVCVRGVDVARDDGFVFPYGVKQEYRVPRSTHSLIVSIAPPLFRKLGWRPSPQAIHRVPRHLLDRLVAVCEDATAEVMIQDGGGVPANAELLRDRILVAVRNAIEPWACDQPSQEMSNNTPSRAFSTVERAEQIMQAIDVEQKLSVPVLAAELGMSERQLYDSFRQWLGIGPYEFHLHCRLHQFRDHLLTGKPHRGKIMQSAYRVGFYHTGRATQAFRRLFGETPREMMKRRGLTTRRAQ